MFKQNLSRLLYAFIQFFIYLLKMLLNLEGELEEKKKEREENTKREFISHDLGKRLVLLEQQITGNAECNNSLIKQLTRVEQMVLEIYQRSCSQDNQNARLEQMIGK